MATSFMVKTVHLFPSHVLRKNIVNKVRPFSDLCKCGKKQSPIDICIAETEPLEKASLKFQNHWDDKVQLCMSLVGSTIQIRAQSDDPLIVEGGVLCGKYKFDQLNLKWGECDTNGSEHSLNGERFGMEAQLVYFNCGFKSAAEALKQQDGIAILGVFLKASEEKHCDLEEIVKKLSALQKSKGDPVGLDKNILPMFKDVLGKQYFTYEGSITMPPCCETIRWLVFKEGICVGKDQVAAFRDICGPEGQIAKNNRDTQQSNCRKIQCVTPKNSGC